MAEKGSSDLESEDKQIKLEQCDPCSVIKKDSVAAKFYCKECEEYLCSECKIGHASSKATKAHIPIDYSICNEKIGNTSEESTLNKSCEPCAEKGKTSDATQYCKECDEMLCNNCTKIHSFAKVTKTHVPVDINEKRHMITKTCEPCLGSGKKCAATWFCEECEELLCEPCCKTHTLQKATKTHIPIRVDKMKTPIQKKCDPCHESKTKAPAKMFCPICDESYCDGCTNAHRNQRATKQHTLIRIENAIESTRLCEPCTNNDTKQSALYYCSDCEECMCEQCCKAHTSQKATRNHKLLNINQIPESHARNCDPCKENHKCVSSSMFCQICKEAYCAACTRAHKSQKATRGHELIQITEMKEAESKVCDVCMLDEINNVALHFCKDCLEYLCSDCSNRHTRQKAYTNHHILSVDEANAEYNEKCEPCLHSEQNVVASTFCKECDEFLCGNCCKQHKAHKTMLLSVAEGTELKLAQPQHLCETCRYQNRNKKATSFCTSCAEPEPMCEECANQHTTQKVFRAHVLSHSLSSYQNHLEIEKQLKEIKGDTTPSKIDKNNSGELESSHVQSEEFPSDIPGKPSGSEFKADSVKLRWGGSSDFSPTDYYQIRYKDVDSKGKWKYYPEEFKTSSAVLTDLKANTKFIFQVRAIHDEVEGPYGPKSDEIMTTNSLATRMVQFSTTIKKGNPAPSLLALPKTENRSARNNAAKTNKYDIVSGRSMKMAEEDTSDLESNDKQDEINLCDRCSFIKKNSFAERFCKQCEECMCTECVSIHISSKATRNHELIDIDQMSAHGIKTESLKNEGTQNEQLATFCDPCSIKGKTYSATVYCKECDEYLCSECKTVHSFSKATKSHMLIEVSLYKQKGTTCEEAKLNKSCEICALHGKLSDATHYCEECEEILCNNCTQIHSSSKATKAHKPVDINQILGKPNKKCNPCLDNEKMSAAARFCKECDELLCEICSKAHTIRKATKKHILIHVDKMKAPIQKKCDPCYESKTEAPASMFCSTCKEAFCDACTNAHRNQRATKQHELIKIEDVTEATRLCEPCQSNDAKQPALYYCTDCKECMCDQCSKTHRSQKATRNHKLLDINNIPEANARNCDPCKENDKCVPSSTFCLTCYEAYCEACSRAHKSQKATRDHELIQISELNQDDNKLCDVCRIDDKSIVALHFCNDCLVYLCDEYSNRHMRQKATKTHQIISVYEADAQQNKKCEPCSLSGKNIVATSFCNECDEFMCGSCCKQHQAQRYSRLHIILSAFEGIELKSAQPQHLCDICRYKNRNKKSTSFCTSCEEPELMCEECANQHTTQKLFRSHVLSHSLSAYQDHLEKEKQLDENKEEKTPSKTDGKKIGEIDSSNVQSEKVPSDIPGKPSGSEIKADSIKLRWDASTDFSPTDYYQIRYKELDTNGKWKFYPKEFTISSTDLTDLKANTKFIFQVRVIHDEVEGPYGPQSDEIMTTNSPATRMVHFATIQKKGTPSPSLLALPITENRNARNNAAKTKKYDIGAPPITDIKERTIMLVGATGTGKSTLVDGIANYALGVNWDDPFRFTVISPEDEETARQQNQDLSQTEWIRCYSINPEQGSRLGYRLNIIDTPGFGDTRGLQRDLQIVNHIRELFSDKGSKGVVCIDAICFLIKAPDARLTATQTYIFHAIIALFGQDVENDICSLITFADGVDPPVLAALKQSDLPFGRHFTFNNSGLFTKNVELDPSSLSPMFWEMDSKSFRAFFDHVEKMQRKSLQLTKEVLEVRKKLEITIQNLQPQVDAGLSKLNEIKLELQIFEQHKTDIEANKDFEYEVTETQQVKTELLKGLHVTNCLNCNFTCHKSCEFANDQDKAKCSAMGTDGNCRECVDKCHWSQHNNTPYIFDYVSVTKKKTYKEKLEKYQKAGGEKLIREKIIEKLTGELYKLEDGIKGLMETVKKCNERLKEIALRPNPFLMVQHIDLMIESEKLEKKEGFMNRIAMLQEFRKNAEIQSHAESFSKQVALTRRSVYQSTNVKVQKRAFSIGKYLSNLNQLK